MSQTDRVPPDFFFAELLLPLRHALARKNIHYLNLEREQESYWRPVASRTGGLEKLSAADCSGDALLARLRQYWATRGDVYLPRLIPYLIALRHDILDATPVGQESRPELGDFVYPIF
jgi:hypothetical protein